MSDGLWVCGICSSEVEDGEAAVRVAADAAVSDGQGGYESLTNREVLVFAIFHSRCVVDTMSDSSLLDIPYLSEARQIIRTAPLCVCCQKQVFGPTKPVLTVMNGGKS